jgi:hypothetical protein
MHLHEAVGLRQRIQRYGTGEPGNIRLPEYFRVPQDAYDVGPRAVVLISGGAPAEVRSHRVELNDGAVPHAP